MLFASRISSALQARFSQHTRDWKSCLIPVNLSANLNFGIKTESIKQEKKVNENVGCLIGGLCHCTARLQVSRRAPLEQLQKLRGLDTDRYREVLRSMELCPITLITEASQAVKQFVHGLLSRPF